MFDFVGDVFDSRDVQKRIDELEAMNVAAAENPETDAMDEDDIEELDALVEFKGRVGSSEWQYGITFVADSYFEEYAQQTAEDIGAISSETAWPCDCIDWEMAAKALQMDYSMVELDGSDYWYRG